MTLSIHLSREIAPFWIKAFAILIGKQCHSFHRESKQRLGAFFVEPLHETFLQPRETFPIWS